MQRSCGASPSFTINMQSYLGIKKSADYVSSSASAAAENNIVTDLSEEVAQEPAGYYSRQDVYQCYYVMATKAAVNFLWGETEKTFFMIY